MDKSIMAAEDTCEGNEPLVSASKCAGSPIQINSIAIDLNCAMGETTQSLTHEHFSILGFAAEMRKKDRKVCLPFDADMNLPLLPVPKFRCWQCLDCLPDILDPESGAGSSSIHNTVEEKDGLQLLQNIEEANQVQTKQITPNNCADENPSTGPHIPGKPSSPSDGDTLFSSVSLKRKPKLRSLADILKEDENSIPAQQIEPELDHQAWLDAPKKGATKTHHRRKKIVLEEEEEETDHPIAKAKRSKGPIIESNNNNTTSRSIEISESESERDNTRPLLFDSRMNAKTDQNKARKHRSQDINRENLHKDPPVTGDTGLFFKNSLFREQMHGISDMSKGKRVEEGGYSPYTPPPMSNDGSLGACNNHEKVALDLSLSSYKGKQECSGRHTEIPDLNELFVEKTCMTEEPQLLTLHKNSDMFASSGKNSNTEPAGKASDDIPMEIVELLAKNQHERTLSNSGKHVGIHSNNPLKVLSPYIEGSGVSSGTTGFLNFPQSKNCDSNWGQFRQFSPPTPDQHKTVIHSGPMNVTRSRLNDSADLLWPPRRKYVSFDLSQPSGLEDHQSCKSKNVKRSAYSNDTIPAMQLLSLMDPRNLSGSSFKLGGSNNFLDRQFSPCNTNNQFASSSSFIRQRQSNGTTDFPTLLSNARCSDNFSSKNLLSLGQVPPHKGNSKTINLAGPSNLSARARRRNPPSEVCCMLNRNPADFSAPGTRNEFMINGKDLERRKRKRRVRNDASRPGGNN